MRHPNFRPDRRRAGDPDETEGRAIYRARANGEARLSIGRTRKVWLETAASAPNPTPTVGM